MNVTKCYKFRLDPTTEQEHQFYQFAGCRRFVWNWALDQKQTSYKLTGKSIPTSELSALLVKMKCQPETAFLKECHSQVLQQTLADLDKAFKGFFEKRARHPKFKARKRTPNAFRITQRVAVVDGKVSVPKIGLVKARLHRQMEGALKSATFKQEADGQWYVVFVSHIELADVEPACDQPCGIDVGLKSFFVLDNGEEVKPPKFYRKSQRKLKRLQRHLSRCQKTSRGRQKAKHIVAKFHRKTANRRNDFLHKHSSKLIERYDTFCIEDLNLKGLAKTKLAKSFNDVAIGSFFQMLDYKSLWNHKQVIRVGRFFPSSKTCHKCGLKNEHLELSDREWTCLNPECRAHHDRDHNAAINLLSEGLRILAAGIAESLNANRGDVRLALPAISDEVGSQRL